MDRRVVITGLGVVTSLGWDLEDFWKKIKNGESGIHRIEAVNDPRLKCQIGAEVKDFDPFPYFNYTRDAKRAERYITFCMAASKLAGAMAGLDFSKTAPDRAGVFLGTGIGGLRTVEVSLEAYLEGGPDKLSPFAIPMMIGNAAGGLLAMDYGITGPNFCVTSACATGTHAAGEAWKTIKFGDADVMFAGGGECTITALTLGGFSRMRALSTRNDEPEKASRPFDADRDGFVMGEGAGVVVMEELEHARNRGADIICELTGYGASADAFHPTLPHPDGLGARQCMDRAMAHARLNPEQVQYINAHGTSTLPGDIAETKAIKEAFGDYAKNGLMVSSTKSMTGHLLGAAGGVELAISALALRDQVIPPTINLDTPDPKCDLDYVPHTARETKIDSVLSNSFGFGGTNASLAVSRFQD